MTSREKILSAIRAQQAPAAEPPSLNQAWISYPDRFAQFASVVEAVGGSCWKVSGLDALNLKLAELPAYREAKERISLVSGAGESNVDLQTIADPHQLETIDFAILPGQFGVAENGAIWVTDEGLKHRALFFITQHLSLVISAAQIVDNLHQAYDRLSLGGSQFGAFISGPSKTADIEQSLVIGAHGPRSLTVFCVT